MNEPPDSALKEKETPKIMDESEKPLNSSSSKSGDKLGMIPAVNLSRLDINKIQSSIKLKLQPSKNLKRLGPKSKSNPIDPKIKTGNVKSICPKSQASPKKNLTKTSQVTQNTTTKASVTNPCSLSSLDEKDFVSGVCLICRLKSEKCTNIFNDTKKFDHIIQRFLPISVNQTNEPKTVCKNCLSVLIAVENLSLKNLNEKPADKKREAIDTSSNDGDSHFVDDLCAEVDVEKSEKSQHSKPHPRISLIPTSKLTSPSQLSSISGPSTPKPLVPTSVIKPSSKASSNIGASGIEIIRTFSLNPEASLPKTKTAAPVIKSEPKIVQSTVVIKSRPSRKVIPPAKFAHFESLLSKPKGKKVTSVKKESKEKTSNTTERKSINLPVETGNKKKVQYTYDVATGTFTDECTEVEKPVNNQRKKERKKDSNKSKIDLKISPEQQERLKEYKKTVHSLRKHITTGGSKGKGSQENASESGISTVEPPVEKEKELLVNAHNPTNLVDISPVMVSYSVSKNIQNLLRLTKRCLTIKVLVPNDKNIPKKNSAGSTPATKDANGKETSDSINLTQGASEKSSSNAVEAVCEKSSSNAVEAVSEKSSSIAVEAATDKSSSNAVEAVSEKSSSIAVEAAIDKSSSNAVEAASEKSSSNAVEAVSEKSSSNAVEAVSEKSSSNAVEATSEKSSSNAVEAASEKSSPSAVEAASEKSLPDGSQPLKKFLETQVEVFSNVIKGYLIPVYFKVLSDSFPSDKVKCTVFSTVSKILAKKKKDALASLEAEQFIVVPSLFKRLQDTFDPSQEKQLCIKCNKRILMSEMMSHIKFTHLPQCLSCKMVCHSSDALEHHQCTCHSADYKKCAVCKRPYQSWFTRVVVHCEHWFRCTFCGQGFLDHNNYMKHERKHFDSDFLDYMYMLNPDPKENLDFLQIKSDLLEKSGCSIIDYFWDKENFPAVSFLTTKDKVFCIKCLLVFDDRAVFKNHICHGEDKCLRFNFATLKCCKCRKAFKSKGTFYRHYQECVDRSFNVTRALQVGSALIEIECALCSNRYYSMEMINDHFDDCYRKNVFECGICQMKVNVHAKEQHLRKCETAREKQENALQGTSDNPIGIDEADNLNTSTGFVLDSQEKAIVDKAVNNNSERSHELLNTVKETLRSTEKEKQLQTVVPSTSSRVANFKDEGMDILPNESLIDFSETVSSTPIPKKFKKGTEVENSKKLTGNQVTKTVPEVVAISATGSQVGGTVPEKSIESSSVIDLDTLEFNLASVETGVKEGTKTNQASLSDLETAAKAVQPKFIKKCFSVKILTTSTDGTPSKVSGETLKSAENLDPNSKELQKLVEESEKAAEIKDVLNVSYAVFFTDVDGKCHLPHHFRLTTADLSQEMKDKASSVIKSLLVKERKKVFKEWSAAAATSWVPMPRTHSRVQKIPPRPIEPSVPFNRGLVQVVCMFCKETFLRSNLRQHILETHMVQCSKCDVYLTSPGELLNHVSIVHNEPYSTCLKCCKKFPLEEDPLMCPCSFICCNCGKVFDNWLQYLDHELTHFHETAFDHAKEANPNSFVMERLRGSLEASRGSNLIYTCQICGKRYSTENDVIKCTHTYKCIACKTVFNCYSLLATHGCSFRYTTNKIKQDMRRNQIQQIKDAKFIHLCPICNVRFDSASLYSTHYTMCAESSEDPIADLHTSYWVKCPYCLRDFNSGDTFLRHHFDCQKANSFMCEVCNDYISNYNKEIHLKDCVQEILCDNCGVSFSNRTTYNFHFRQQRDGTITCKSLITDDDGAPFETAPDPEIVMKSIQDGTFNLTACNYCGKMFGNPRKTSKHIIDSHLDKVKSCPVCKVKLSRSKSSLLAHRKSHTTAELVDATKGDDYGPFRCFKCSRCFSSSYHKILHQIYYHQKEILCCTVCQKEFISKLCLHNHQMTCSEPKEATPKAIVKKVGKDHLCQTCNTPFTNYHEYIAHKKTHINRYACDMCEKTFLSKHILNDHKKRIHFGTPSTCEICGLAFGCLKNLQIHQRNQHMDRPPCICDTCGKSFKTSKHLRVHVTLHTGEKPYACKHCDRRFRLKQNLTQHEYKHSNDPKPFKCPLCLAKFTQFNNLHLHKRQVHPETFKYMCPKCKCGYNDLNYFTKHVDVCGLERQVTGKKHFNNGVSRAPRTTIKECPYCNENVESLRLHLLRRTDEKPYFCKTCPKKFSFLCTLKHHELQHFNSKKFTCKFCDKGFLGLKQYSFHLQMKHNDLFPLHCAHCSKGYNENKYYYKHIQQCNEFIEKPIYNPNSKKLTPECPICLKIFLKFNDLRIHSAMVHKTQAHKRYQCQICDSAYDSNALLLKHSKHHFKDRHNPGMFLCPKCQFQHHEFKTILNHNCPFLTNLGDPEASHSSSSKRASSSNYAEPAKKRKSSRVSKKPAALLEFESDDEDVADFSDDDSDSSSVEDKQKVENIEDYEEYKEYNVNDILVQPPEVKVTTETFQVNPESIIEETVADSSNFIYHCSFCKENYDTLTRLQNHLRKDHGFDLNNLEFQVI